MAYQDNKDWGEKIQGIVDDVLDSQDFDELNRTIRNTIDMVFDEWQVGSGTRHHTDFDQKNRPQYSRDLNSRQGYTSQDRAAPNYRRPLEAVETRRKVANEKYAFERQNYQGSTKPMLFPRQVSGGFSGGLAMAVGGGFTAFWGFTTLITLAATMWVGDLGAGIVATIAMAPFLIGSGALFTWGRRKRKRVHRYHTYRNVLADRKYCQVTELAAAVDKTPDFVRKDLRTMIRKRMFLQGHMDVQGTTFMVDDETYRQYLETEHNYQLRVAEARSMPTQNGNASDSATAEPADTRDPEFVKALAEGESYVREIRKANDMIPGEEITRKLDRLEELLSKIFAVLEKNPDQLGRLRKFMTYYMPTTRKLVQTYQELDAQPVEGENIRKAKTEIEDTLDTINDAYEKLLDSFYEDAAMDVHAERKVMENMLTEDGLTDSPFQQMTMN